MEFVVAFGTIPKTPEGFDSMLQTVIVVWTKSVLGSFLVSRIWLWLHGRLPSCRFFFRIGTEGKSLNGNKRAAHMTDWGQHGCQARTGIKKAQGPDASGLWGITFHPGRFWFARFAPPRIKLIILTEMTIFVN